MLARSAAEIDRLRDAWEGLYSPADHTLFQTFAWNRLAAAHFGHEAPFVSFFEDDNGAALVPAAIAHRSRIVMMGERLFDYRDVLAVGDLSALAEAWRPFAELELPLSITAVRQSSAAHWCFAALVPFCAAPRVRQSEASADLMEAQHRKLGRFSRRLRRQGLELRTHDGSSSQLLRWIYEQKSLQFRGDSDNIFAEKTRVEFMVAAAALRPDSCQIFTYEQGSQIVAALLSFRDGEVRRFYTVWFDLAWAKESPGQVLVYEATVDALRTGLDCDYMTGEQPHKTRLATSSEALYRVELSAEQMQDSIDRMDAALPKAA